MKNYNKLNNIVGWEIFGISFLVYLFSMAPTASFWDCGEFIACANELEVPHPPGAPFFLILGRLFAMFAPSPEAVAFMVNMVSVLASAFCVLFVFWTVTHLAKKLVAPGEKNPSDPQKNLLIMVAGVVGALTCTFADSFWFNAVEAEVYALSSFFTAIVVWLMFKWEARADEADNLKWIVLIAFVMGVSIGVHLLNLLTIPALAFIYYFKKFEIKPVGIITTFLISVVILGFIQYGIIQLSVEIAWAMERVFTGVEQMDTAASVYQHSGMGLPMGTGVIFFLLITMGMLVAALVFTQSDKLSQRFFTTKTQNRRVVINTVAWGLLTVLIGYSSYSMIVIRAQAGTPINENDPSSVSSMLSYLKREQYGDRPLFRGVRYNKAGPRNQKVEQGDRSFVNLREPRALKNGKYTMDDGKAFEVKGGKITGMAAPAPNAGDVFEGALKDGRQITINPKTMEVTRIEDRYLWDGYKSKVSYNSGHVFFPRMHSSGHYSSGEYGYKYYISKKNRRNQADPFDDRVTMGDDMKFFLDYQFRHMYWRYFMWNFAGREGDIQDMGWQDGLLLRGGSDLPEELASHPGRNHYFLLPLLLGLFGMVYHFMRHRKDATSIMLLFFFTGIAIILYLNQTPQQPRERDYSYAGSFQTFAIWVGLAVIGLWDLLRDLKMSKNVSMAAACAPIIAPLIMGFMNWDDHTRALRYVAPDSAYNLLNSCEKNAILFTNGDNDTFPLWYIQEVENVRTDVRVVNLSLLNTDWYIDQMKQQSNESPPLPITAKQIDYVGDKNAFRRFPKGKVVDIPVDKSKVMTNGTVLPEYAQYVVSPMKWTVGTRGGEQNSYLLKQDWLIMDMLLTNAQQGWPRPIYFSSTIPPASYVKLQPYFQVEGLANRVVPVDFSKIPVRSNDPYGRSGRIQKEISYNKIINVFKYRELDNEDLYIDDHIRRTIVGNMVSMMFRTSNAFVDDMDHYVAVNNSLAALKKTVDSTNTAKRDSIQAIIDANEKIIADDRAKAEEILVFCETKITDKARGHDVIYPMFAGTVWDRLGKKEKAKEYFSKVIDKAEAWINYRVKNDDKLRDYDRIVNTLPFLMQKANELKDYETAARAADLMFLDTNDPQYQARAQQFRSLMGTEGTPQPPAQPVPNP